MSQNAIEELDAALKIIGSLAVTHDAQEIVVSAKSKIRKAIALIEKEAKQDG